MSIGKRLIDLAKANLNALLDKTGDGGIDELSDDELEAELARRRERRKREEAEQRARYSAEEAARTRAAERAHEAGKARGTIPGASSSAGRSPSQSARDEQRRAPSSSLPPTDRRLRELYAQLEVPFGAPFEEVKKSFRRLMRKYHPDLHLGNPQKHKTATQLTMSLTQAYNELELHLVRGRRA